MQSLCRGRECAPKSNLDLTQNEVREFACSDRGAAVSLSEVLRRACETAINDHGTRVTMMAGLRGEGQLDSSAIDVVVLRLGQDRNSPRAEIGDQVGILAARAVRALDLGAERAAYLDDKVLPLGFLHCFPFTLQQRGFLQLA